MREKLRNSSLRRRERRSIKLILAPGVTGYKPEGKYRAYYISRMRRPRSALQMYRQDEHKLAISKRCIRFDFQQYFSRSRARNFKSSSAR